MSSFTSTIRKFNVEPILFLQIMARLLYQPSVLQSLMTDKLCANDYNLDVDDFCYKINSPQNKNSTDAINIQKDVVQYAMYQQLIISIPSVIAAIFIGPWMDLHLNFGPKIVLILNLLASIFETVVILLNIYFFEAHVGLILLSFSFTGIFGGPLLFMTAIFTIAMKSTPIEERTMRFTTIEFALVLPNPVANLISSFIFPLKPMFIDYQIHNYVPILLISMSTYLICLFLVIFTIGKITPLPTSPDDNLVKRLSVTSTIQPVINDFVTLKDKNIEETSLSYVNSAFENETTDHSENNNFSDINSKENNQIPSLSNTENEKATKGYIIKSLFRLSNLIVMIRSLTKRREENVHRLLWSLVFIYIATLTTSDGISIVMVPFVTVVYGMRMDDYLRANSVGVLVISITSICFLSFLNKIDLMDTKKIFIGLSSLFFFNFMRGIILYPMGLYMSYLLGFILLCSVVSCRGLVSKLVDSKEIATILSLFSVFYACCPILSSLVYTQVFKYSVKFYPGLAFLCASFIILIALLVNIYLHINYLKYDKKMKSKKLTNAQA